MKILVYADKGVSRESLQHTLYTFSTRSPQKINSKTLLNTHWEKETDLFILPGGADIPYMRLLKGEGNRKIRSFVENGGTFIGICAGAYYAGSAVEFALDTKNEVRQSRELKFFPGTIRGPILAPYDYQSNSGARAAHLYSKHKKLGPFFYNGGGYFVNAFSYKNVSVLATYDAEQKQPAIITCQIGKGKALLSGVHFEYHPHLLDEKDPFLKPIIPSIASGCLSQFFSHEGL